ncbi:hypothetical protein Tco_0914315 [Tanacetum coccineum]
MSKQSREVQDHDMTVNREARNPLETKLQGRLLALKYQVKQGSLFQVKAILGSDRSPLDSKWNSLKLGSLCRLSNWLWRK